MKILFNYYYFDLNFFIVIYYMILAFNALLDYQNL